MRANEGSDHSEHGQGRAPVGDEHAIQFNGGGAGDATVAMSLVGNLCRRHLVRATG